MNIVLVCVDNFQEYILVNIKQLILLNHQNIFIITNTRFFDFFSEFKNKIVLVASENLEDTFNYKPANNIDNSFRNGFWGLTSKRFFYIYSFMQQRNIKDVLHIENDVLIYYNCDKINIGINNNKIWVPADSKSRSIASIMVIPNHEILRTFLMNYDNRYNDMINLSRTQHLLPYLFDNFPICVQSDKYSTEQHFVTRTYPMFNMIFDAAAIGQYLGGIDPRNNPADSIGFINETSVIKYNNYRFVWHTPQDNIKRPYMKLSDNTIIPIFNLHIHSKKLSDFV